jgi:hypothetical protein
LRVEATSRTLIAHEEVFCAVGREPEIPEHVSTWPSDSRLGLVRHRTVQKRPQPGWGAALPQALVELLVLLDDRPRDFEEIVVGLCQKVPHGGLGYRRLLARAQVDNTDVRSVLERLDRGEINIPFAGPPLERWRLLRRELERLELFREDLPRLIDELLPAVPAGQEDDLVALRTIANAAVEEEPRPNLRELVDPDAADSGLLQLLHAARNDRPEDHEPDREALWQEPAGLPQPVPGTVRPHVTEGDPRRGVDRSLSPLSSRPDPKRCFGRL